MDEVGGRERKRGRERSASWTRRKEEAGSWSVLGVDRQSLTRLLPMPLFRERQVAK
jgi:hypothetical protein